MIILIDKDGKPVKGADGRAIGFYSEKIAFQYCCLHELENVSDFLFVNAMSKDFFEYHEQQTLLRRKKKT